MEAADATAFQPDNLATELAAMYRRRPGPSLEGGYPYILTRFWGGQSSLIMEGAIRAFQSNQGLTMTGVMTSALWRDVVRAPRRQTNPNGYTYALASKAQPGDADRVARRARRHAHPGQHRHPGRAHRDGTFPVYLRYRSRSCAAPTRTVAVRRPGVLGAYFDGGEAVHYFPRGSYGFPQSLGCVELPYAQAARCGRT